MVEQRRALTCGGGGGAAAAACALEIARCNSDAGPAQLFLDLVDVRLAWDEITGPRPAALQRGPHNAVLLAGTSAPAAAGPPRAAATGIWVVVRAGKGVVLLQVLLLHLLDGRGVGLSA